MGWMRRYLGEFKCSQVLDVATGTGRFIEDLRILMAMTGNRHVQIIGVDRLRGAVASAPNRSGDTHFLAMDATRLGFSDSSFDLVCLAKLRLKPTSREAVVESRRQM